ncbi:MAG: tol-pal system YbgF family protein [Bacteriovoracia bacterium]
MSFIRVAITTLIFFAAWGASLSSVAGPFDQENLELDSRGVPRAAPKAAADTAATTYQQAAISKLKILIKKRVGTKEEAGLLMRMATLEQEKAESLFRIAHAEAYFAKKRINLAPSQKQLNQSVKTLSDVITRYPNHYEIPLAYAMRGRAYNEVGKRNEAIADYLIVIQRFPEYSGIKAVYWSLSEFAFERNKPEEALPYLHYLERDKSDREYYPYALQKTAWAHYQLDKLDESFRYVKLYVKYQNVQIDEAHAKKKVATTLHRDEMLLDSTMFYMRAYNLKAGEYAIEDAVDFFGKLNSGGAQGDNVLGQMLIRFTKLLRSENKQGELAVWKKSVIQKRPDDPICLTVLVTVLEDELNKYNFKAAQETLNDLAKLKQDKAGKYPFDIAEDFLLTSVNKIQAQIKKQPNSPNRAYYAILIGLYKTFLTVAERRDHRIVQAHYNLGESFAGLQQPQQAVAHYRWLINNIRHGSSLANKAGINISEAGLKSVSILYDALNRDGKIAESVDPVAVARSKPSELPAAYTEWNKLVAQVDGMIDEKNPLREKMNFFVYQSMRTQYARGHVEDASKRFLAFVERYPTSQYAQPSAALVVDTMIASERWDLVFDLSSRFLRMPDLNRTKFSESLKKSRSDSAYKIAEGLFNAKQYKEVIDKSDDEVDFLANPRHKADWLNLVARSAIALGRTEVALQTLTRTVEEMPDSRYFADSMKLRASTFEDNFDFGHAARDYLKIHTSGDAEASRTMRRKIAQLAWLSEDEPLFIGVMKNKKVCLEDIVEECDRYVALHALRKDEPFRGVKRRIMSEKGKALWALVDLKNAKNASYKRRVTVVSEFASYWTKFDSLTRFSLVHDVPDMVQAAVQNARESIRKIQVEAEAKSIGARVRQIKSIEEQSEGMLKIPFARVHAKVVNEIAGMYLDLAADVQAVPVPEGLNLEEQKIYASTLIDVVKPFQMSALKLHKKALDIVKAFGSDDPDFVRVSQTIPGAAPAGKDADKHEDVYGNRLRDFSDLSAALGILSKIDPSGFWSELDNRDGNFIRALKAKWVSALKARHWPQIGYVLERAEQTDSISKGVLGVMRAISLAVAGAKAEALHELKESQDRFDSDARKWITVSRPTFTGVGLIAVTVVRTFWGVDAAQAASNEVVEAEKNTRGKKLDFEDGVVEGVNKAQGPDGSVAAKWKQKKREHIYSKEISFDRELENTLRGIRYEP